jgi:multicomponent Na+:H+ antiporter subunit C
MTDTLSGALIYGLCGAGLVGLGLYGFVARRHLLRRVLAFNVIGSGIFLLFGATAHRRPELGTDPVPQALIITGIVVALSLTALVVALVVRFAGMTGSAFLPEEVPERTDDRASD